MSPESLPKQFKVLQVIDSLNTGGAERVIVDLSNILHSYGVHVELLCTLGFGPLLKDLNPAIKTHNLDRNNRSQFTSLWHLRKLLRQFDIVHIHMRHVAKYVYVCNKVFMVGAKLIFHDHNGDIKINRSFSPLLQRVMKDCFYVSVSDELTEWAITDVGVDKNRAFTLSNVVLPAIQDTEFKISSERPVKMALVSNFRATKNIEFAVELMAELEHRCPGKYYLDVYGKINDHEYYESVLQKYNKHRLSPDVLKFQHEQDSVQTIIGSYDLAIHTARSESGPLVLMEYLANDLPFISYDTGEVLLKIKDQIPELVIDHFNIEGWVNRIEDLPVKTIKESGRLSKVFSENFSAQAYFNKCLSVYERVL